MHVVVNIVLFYATCMYTVVDTMHSVCMFKRTNSMGTQKINMHGDTININRTNPMRAIYRGTICGDTTHVQRTNPMPECCM